MCCRGRPGPEPGGWGDDQSYYEEEYYYDESEDDIDDYSRKPVPILLSILLVIIYIVGGAFLFQMWEGWSFLDRSYSSQFAFSAYHFAAPTFVSSPSPPSALET